MPGAHPEHLLHGILTPRITFPIPTLKLSGFDAFFFFEPEKRESAGRHGNFGEFSLSILPLSQALAPTIPPVSKGQFVTRDFVLTCNSRLAATCSPGQLSGAEGSQIQARWIQEDRRVNAWNGSPKNSCLGDMAI